MKQYEDLPLQIAIVNPKKKRTRKQKVHVKPKAKKKKVVLHVPSPMETNIACYLSHLGIKYKTEKTFIGLESALYPGRLLPVDFYCKVLNLVIEYDGIHHYRTMVKDKSESDLDRRILNDKTKDLFCLQRGIRMLRISYKEAKLYKQIIDDELLKIKEDRKNGKV